MPGNRFLSHLACWLTITACALAASPSVDAATVWNGPAITFTKVNNGSTGLAQNQDRMTDRVWITRAKTMGIYNVKVESAYTSASPADTEWAYGNLSDYASLTYQNWVEWAQHNPPATVGKPAVLHLKTDDIYIAITFTAWTDTTGGGFSYARSTPGGAGPTIASAIEYYNAGFDHYFITRNPDEITKLDNGTFAGWARTGQSFNVYVSATPGANSVCRFFSTAFDPKSSHFYTPFTDECAAVKNNAAWQFEGEGEQIFYIPVASSIGSCDTGTTPVYRLYNNGMGNAPNHRYTTSGATRDQMLSAGWVIEGNGPGFAFMCSPM